MDATHTNLVGRAFKKILVVELSLIGDVVMLTPAISALRKAYPNATISLLAQSFASELFKCGVVDEVITYDKREKDKGISGFWRIVAKLRKRNFDASFIFHKSFGSALICSFAQIPVRIGFNTEMRGIFLTHKIEPAEIPLHIVDENLYLLKACGIDTYTRKLEVAPDFSQEGNFFKRYAPMLCQDESNLPVIVICPHGGWETKNWKPSYISTFIDLFPVGSAHFILVGGAGEEHYAEQIYSVNNSIINLVGKTTLRELCYVLKRANVVVSPDTSVVHIATALGKPVIALFGPTAPERCGPTDIANCRVITGKVNCLKCFLKKCTRQPFCMDTITPEEVKQATDDLLATKQSKVGATHV